MKKPRLPEKKICEGCGGALRNKSGKTGQTFTTCELCGDTTCDASDIEISALPDKAGELFFSEQDICVLHYRIEEGRNRLLRFFSGRAISTIDVLGPELRTVKVLDTCSGQVVVFRDFAPYDAPFRLVYHVAALVARTPTTVESAQFSRVEERLAGIRTDPASEDKRLLTPQPCTNASGRGPGQLTSKHFMQVFGRLRELVAYMCADGYHRTSVVFDGKIRSRPSSEQEMILVFDDCTVTLATQRNEIPTQIAANRYLEPQSFACGKELVAYSNGDEVSLIAFLMPHDGRRIDAVKLIRELAASPGTPVPPGYTANADEETDADLLALYARLSEIQKLPRPLDASTLSRENALLSAFAANTIEDAIDKLIASFPELTTEDLHAGMMHAKGRDWNLTWADMMKRAKCSKSTLSKRINHFYEVTRWHRADRRKGMGRKLRLDEGRDGEDPREQMFDEHCEHPEHPRQ